MLVTLRNDFHGSSAKVHVPPSGELTPSQYASVLRRLCGIRGCRCGGIRGPQEVDIEGTPDSIRVYPKE